MASGRDSRLPDRVMATVAAAEAVLLIGYAISIAWVAITQGITGPADVSTPTGVVVETAVFLTFGVGMAVVAVGRFRGSDATSVPFLIAQVLALTVGVPMVTGAGAGRPAGALITLLALLGLGSQIGRAVTAPALPEDTSTRRV